MFGRSRIEYLSEQTVDDRLEDIGQGASSVRYRILDPVSGEYNVKKTVDPVSGEYNV
jgi:hypothetical protein